MTYWNDMAQYPRAGSAICFEEAFDKADVKTVCAWCARHLGGRRRARLVSHGICPPCSFEMLGAGVEAPDDPWELWRDEGVID